MHTRRCDFSVSEALCTSCPTEVAVQGWDSERFGDCLLFLIKHWRSATGTSLLFRRFHTCKCSLPQQISLELGEGTKHGEDPRPPFGEGGKSDADRFEVGHRFQQVRKASTEPVEAPHGQGAAGSKVFDDCGQFPASVCSVEFWGILNAGDSNRCRSPNEQGLEQILASQRAGQEIVPPFAPCCTEQLQCR